MNEIPRFAVVGHPNKGKSSIVATLSQNDDITIALEPGTTRDSQAYPLRVDQETLYELIDTPGFQRPRRLLAWLRANSHGASDRPDTVRAFITQHRDDPRFHDECELLTPILDGAGILYVVDGSVPYSSEQEAEMEILRWTGRPRLALINRIGADDHGDAWRAALDQYFLKVYDFDAVRAPFEKHLELLRGFGEMAPAWREPLERAVDYLQAQREQRQRQALVLVATALGEMLSHQARQRLADDADRAAVETGLRNKWRDWQRQREQRLRRDVEALYHHRRLQRQESALQWDSDDDLFSERARRTWSAGRAYLATAGFGVGAVGGSSLDVITAGHTLGAGTLIGGLIGAVGGLYYPGKLGRIKIGPLSTGGREALFGPVRDPQFGYVVLGRALEHAWRVAHRNHAGRDPLALEQTNGQWLERLEKRQRVRLQKALQSPPKDSGDRKRRDALAKAVLEAGTVFNAWRDSAD